MTSLRGRLFFALAAAALLGALSTGLSAIWLDAASLGFHARLLRVIPKAVALAALLIPLSALAAALVGRRLARPIERLTSAATRIAEGARDEPLPRGEGDEVEALSRALCSMRRELEGKPYAAAFLRDAFHDLKTPVAALRATLEVMDEDVLDDRVTTLKFLENLRRSTERMERTLHDLVTLARYETAALGRERETSVDALIGGAIDEVAPLAEATKVTVGASPSSESLRCDPAVVGRALSNLLENAVRASPGGRIEISSKRERDRLVLEVANGPSVIPAEKRATLFRRGPGLGLAMARAAIEARGGSVRFVEHGPPRVRVRLELPG